MERPITMSDNGSNEDRVAVLVDCDNTSPEILEYARERRNQRRRD